MLRGNMAEVRKSVHHEVHIYDKQARAAPFRPEECMQARETRLHDNEDNLELNNTWNL